MRAQAGLLAIALAFLAGCEQVADDLLGDKPAPKPDFVGPMPRWISWNPQETAIAYEQGGLLIVARDGILANALPITGVGNYRHPSWSPDGRHIVHDYSPDRFHPANLWVRPVEEKAVPRRLTEGRVLDFMPLWSADGRWVAFHSRRSPADHVWVIPAEGGTARPVGPALANERSLAWSPGDARLAYEALGARSPDIWIADVDMGSTRHFVGTDASDAHPLWTPDGTAVGFLSLAHKGWNVWVQPDASDATPRQITTLGGVVHFEWLSGGAAILFLTGDGALYAQPVAEGSTPSYVRQAADFAVARSGKRYVYVEYEEPTYRVRVDTVPAALLP
jgi:hypothetical protein